MRNFWVSWVSNVDDGRPVKYPPGESIIGFWISGYDANDNEIYCAWVNAEDDKAAKAALAADWPELKGKRSWRFFNECANDFDPGDRFPAYDTWQKKRRKHLSR